MPHPWGAPSAVNLKSFRRVEARRAGKTVLIKELDAVAQELPGGRLDRATDAVPSRDRAALLPAGDLT